MAKSSGKSANKDNAQNKYATQKQIAALLKISEYDVKKFIRLGFPKAGHNKYVAADCVSWYLDYLEYWRDRRTISEIAAMLGITERWLNRLVLEKGIKKEKHGTYKLDQTITSYVIYLKEQIKKAEEGERTLADERKRLLKMQADVKEIELLEKQKQLIPVDVAAKLLTNYAAIVDKKIDMMDGYSLNKLFASKTKEEILKVLKETKHHIKTEIANARPIN